MARRGLVGAGDAAHLLDRFEPHPLSAHRALLLHARTSPRRESAPRRHALTTGGGAPHTTQCRTAVLAGAARKGSGPQRSLATLEARLSSRVEAGKGSNAMHD